MSDVIFVARVRAFGTPLQARRVLVDDDGLARVWDEVAGHYVVCELSPTTRARLAGIARRVRLIRAHVLSEVTS